MHHARVVSESDQEDQEDVEGLDEEEEDSEEFDDSEDFDDLDDTDDLDDFEDSDDLDESDESDERTYAPDNNQKAPSTSFSAQNFLPENALDSIQAASLTPMHTANPPRDPSVERVAQRMHAYLDHQVYGLTQVHPSWWGSFNALLHAVGQSAFSSDPLSKQSIRGNQEPPLNTIRSTPTHSHVHFSADTQQGHAIPMRDIRAAAQSAGIPDAEPLNYSAQARALRQRCMQVLFLQAGIPLPSAVDFEGEAGHIGALSWSDARRLCRMRALIFRRAALRRRIDKASRMHMQQWLESKVLDQLMQFPGSPQLEVLTHAFDMPDLQALSTADLEWEGLHLLGRDGVWDVQGPFAHLRLCFAQGQVPPMWIRATLNETGQIDVRFDPEGSMQALALLQA